MIEASQDRRAAVRRLGKWELERTTREVLAIVVAAPDITLGSLLAKLAKREAQSEQFPASDIECL